MSHRIDLTDLTAIHDILDDLWERRVKSDNIDQWWQDNLTKILNGRVAVKVILNRLDAVELNVVE